MRVFFFCCLLSPFLVSPSWGEWKLRSDFRALIDPEVLAEQIEKNFERKQETENFSLEDVEEVRGDIKIRVSGIQGRAEYEIAPFQYIGKQGSSLLWDTSSSYLGILVTIDEIHAEAELVKKFNGGTIRIRLTSTCNNIQLSLPRNAGASINIGASSLVSGSSLQFTADNANLFWPRDSWQVTNIDCHGDDGFEKEAEKLIQEYVDTIKDSVAADFESRLNSNLQDLSKEFSEKLLAYRLLFSNNDESIKVDLEPEYLDQSRSADLIVGGSLHGHAPKVFDGVFQETDRRFTSRKEFHSGKTEIQVPLTLLNDVLLGSHIFELFKIDERGSSFSQWEKFRRDRRAVGFVFPDLNKFSRDKDFKITGSSLYNPSLKNFISKGAGRGVRAEFFFPIFINISAPYLNDFIPYVQFRGYVKGYTSMRVTSDGRLEFVVESSKTYLNYYWSLEYVQMFQPNERIKIDIISENIDEMLKGSNVHWDLPYLELNKQKLKISDFSIENDTIRVFWQQSN